MPLHVLWCAAAPVVTRELGCGLLRAVPTGFWVDCVPPSVRTPAGGIDTELLEDELAVQQLVPNLV